MSATTANPNSNPNANANDGKKQMDIEVIKLLLNKLRNDNAKNNNMILLLEDLFSAKDEKERFVLHVFLNDSKLPCRRILRTTQTMHEKTVCNFKNAMRRSRVSEPDIEAIVNHNQQKYDGLVKKFSPTVGEDMTTYLLNKYFVLSDK